MMFDLNKLGDLSKISGQLDRVISLLEKG